MVGLIFAMVGRQFRTSLRIEMMSTDLLSCLFFTILYHLLDCKMVSDRFWMIYGVAENPRPTGKCVKYTPAALGLMSLTLKKDRDRGSYSYFLDHKRPTRTPRVNSEMRVVRRHTSENFENLSRIGSQNLCVCIYIINIYMYVYIYIYIYINEVPPKAKWVL